MLPATARAQAQVSPDNYEILNAGPPKTEPLRIGVENRVAVEKLASEKSAKIKTEGPQAIFSSRLDIFNLLISAYFEKR